MMMYGYGSTPGEESSASKKELSGALISWQFLGEPFWRWFIFFIAMGFALRAWRAVVDEMT